MNPLTPTLMRDRSGAVTIVDPPVLAGLEVLEVPGAGRCQLPLPDLAGRPTCCPLVAGHPGACWTASPELVATQPWPLAVADPTARLASAAAPTVAAMRGGAAPGSPVMMLFGVPLEEALGALLGISTEAAMPVADALVRAAYVRSPWWKPSPDSGAAPPSVLQPSPTTTDPESGDRP